MKIYIPCNSKQTIGGGFTARNNLIKGGKGLFEIVNTWQECDIMLIMGVTMIDRVEVEAVKNAGKKIVCRIDNFVKDSRNRGTAISRMRDFSKVADYIVFQSEWAKDYVGWWFVDNGVEITNKSSIIYNGVDKEFFFENNNTVRKNNRYLYAQYNRDENKRVTEAFYSFHKAFRKDKDSELWLVGQFSPILIEYGFDFFAGENVNYLGIIDDRKQLGEVMRSCQYLLFPAFADASSNQLTESLACGCEPIGINPVGGSIEIVNRWKEGIIPSIQETSSEYLQVFNKLIK